MNVQTEPEWLPRLARLLALPLAVIALAVLLTLQAKTQNTDKPVDSTTETIVAENIGLQQLVPAFEQAFFAREPGMSYSEYVAKLHAYVDESFIDTLPSDGFPSDRHISVSMNADPQISYDQDETVALVSSSLEIKETKNNQTLATSNLEHTTEWRYDNGQWLVFPSLPR